MAYLIQVERLEQRAVANQVIAAVAALGGATPEIDDPDTARQRFDEWLTTEPPAVDDERQTLMRVLGVAG